MNNIEKTFSTIDRNFDLYLDEFKKYLRQPGISHTGEGIEESAELTLKLIHSLRNTRADLVRIGGNPIIFGKTSSGTNGAKTLLVYSFYDLVPVVPEDWISPPFEPTILDAERIGLPSEFGRVLCARGVIDHRGPSMAVILGLRAIQEATGGSSS